MYLVIHSKGQLQLFLLSMFAGKGQTKRDLAKVNRTIAILNGTRAISVDTHRHATSQPTASTQSNTRREYSLEGSSCIAWQNLTNDGTRS